VHSQAQELVAGQQQLALEGPSEVRTVLINFLTSSAGAADFFSFDGFGEA
jgi:hypothetical protein